MKHFLYTFSESCLLNICRYTNKIQLMINKLFTFVMFAIALSSATILQAQCSNCDITINSTNGNTLTLESGKIHCVNGTMNYDNISLADNATICIPAGSKLTIKNNIENNTASYTVNFEIHGELEFSNARFNSNINMNIYDGGKYTSSGVTGFSGSNININNQGGTFYADGFDLNGNSAKVKITNGSSAVFSTGHENISGSVKVYVDNQGTFNMSSQLSLTSNSYYSNCGTLNTASINLQGGTIYNTKNMTINGSLDGSGNIYNYGTFTVNILSGGEKTFYNTGSVVVTGNTLSDITVYGPKDLPNYGEFKWSGATGVNNFIVNGNQLFTNSNGTSSLQAMFTNSNALKPQANSNIAWSNCESCVVNTTPSYCIDSETGKPQQQIPNVDYCDQITPPNGLWPVDKNGNVQTDSFAKQLLFFNFKDGQLDKNTKNLSPDPITVNGITYTAKISDFNEGVGTNVNMIFKGESLGNTSWRADLNQMIGNHLDIPNFNEVLYKTADNIGGSATAPVTSTLKITVTATKAGVNNIPITVAVFDAETTSQENSEKLAFTTSGQAFTILKSFGSGNPDDSFKVSGKKVTYIDTQKHPLNAIFTTDGNNSIVLNTEINTKRRTQQGLGFAVRLPCPIVAVNDVKEVMAIDGAISFSILSNDHYGENGRSVDSSNVDVVLFGGTQGSTVSSDRKTLTVPGEGVWSYNDNGMITFIPETGFTKAPTSINYTIIDKVSFVEATAQISITIGYCYKLPKTNSEVTIPILHGITALNRANSKNGNWPSVRQSGWTVLEAKTKGFVINRVAFDPANGNPQDIPAANFVEGMMVYDTTNHCLKIYDGEKWGCLSTQTCPNN